jgi:hypothetical protein
MGVPSVGFRTTEAAERRFCLPEHNTFLCRCVRSPSKYGFQPSREGEGGFYGRWEKPWTFGDTPFKLLPYRDQAKQASVPRGGGTVTRVRKLTRGRLEGKKYVIPANKTEATRWYTSGKPL